MTWDRVADPPDEAPREVRHEFASPRWYRWPATIVLLVAIVLAAIVFASGSGDRPQVQGEQSPGLTSRVRGPGTRTWIALTADDGVERAGWPLPMIAREVELTCFGFGRTDFEEPRPTLARCVETFDIPDLPTNGIVSLVVVQAGFDTWHLLHVGGDATDVDLVDADGIRLDGGRVHTEGDLVALRLPTSTDLSELSWIIGRERIVCSPAPGAAQSAELCPAG